MSQIFKDADAIAQKAIRTNYELCGLMPKYHALTWHDFVNDARAKEIVQRYVNVPTTPIQKGLGFYLYGINGVGKTMLLNLAFQELFHKRYSVRVMQLSDIVDMWFEKDTRSDLISTVNRVHFLGIEEIGKEYRARNSEYVVSILDYIVKVRDQKKKPLWVTSNVPPEDIKDLYTEDIASMLRGTCVTLKVNGDDYRRNIQEENKKLFK